MKVLSMMQPWATLVAVGEKKIETRSWATKYSGYLAIHASLSTKFITMGGKNYLLDTEPFYSVSQNSKFMRSVWKGCTFPLGYIIAVCKLVDILKVLPWPQMGISAKEFSFGDYTPGRFAWIFEDVKVLENPIPIKGRLGLWESPLCRADCDGDCMWSGCPQLRDGEPTRSGRSCPLDLLDSMDPFWFGA